MPRYIVVHRTPSELGQEQLVADIKKLVAHLPPGVHWLNSWFSPKEGGLFCEWDAPDADAVQASLAPFESLVPIETIYEVEWIDPAWFD
jgi:hypothetical protein